MDLAVATLANDLPVFWQLDILSENDVVRVKKLTRERISLLQISELFLEFGFKHDPLEAKSPILRRLFILLNFDIVAKESLGYDLVPVANSVELQILELLVCSWRDK